MGKIDTEEAHLRVSSTSAIVATHPNLDEMPLTGVPCVL